METFLHSPFMNAPEDEESFIGGQLQRPRPSSFKRWFWPVLLVSILVFSLLTWILGNFSSGHTQQVRTLNESLTPPNLVHRSDLKSLHYCGFDPTNYQSFPYIPPLADDNFELVLVQGFIRHGDRFFDSGRLCWLGQQNVTYDCQMSEVSFPGTKFSDSSIPNPSRLYRKRFMTNRNDFEGNCMVGQLSEKGYHQEMALGTIFRSAYVGGLLKSSLDTNEVFFRSDDVPRTVMSAQAFISGMYPDNQGKNGEASIVDIWTMDFDRETEISNPHDCPGLTNNVFKALHSEAYQNHINTFSATLRDRLAPVIGIPSDKITDSEFDCSYVSACRGTPLPESLTLDLLGALEQDALFKFYYPLQFPNRIDGARLAAGPLIREIYERMNRVIETRSKALDSQVDDPNIKFSLYSGHDTGPIMLILSAFELEDDFWAPYASYISLELYQSVESHKFFVRLVYNGKAMKFPQLQDGAKLLPFSSFRKAVLPMIPSREDCPDIYNY